MGLKLKCVFFCLIIRGSTDSLCSILWEKKIDMADDRGGMEAPGTRAPRALGHLFFF